MKVGILTPSFGEQRFIGACIDQFKGFGMRHLVMCSTVGWNGHEENDNTADIAESHGADVMVGEWRDENKQRLEGILELSDNDWILIVDSDEYYTRRAIEKMLEALENAEDNQHIFNSYKMEVYWKSWDLTIRPLGYPPIVAIKPHVRFTNIRDAEGQRHTLPFGVITHHLSYVRTDAEVWRKIKSWGHSHEVKSDWYENVWKKWDYETEDFHPVRGELYHKVIENPLPDEIKDRLEENSFIVGGLWKSQ